MDKHLEEFLEKIYDEGYGYIANNYTKFSKEELRDIALELLYTVTEGLDMASRVRTLAIVKTELKDKWEPVEDIENDYGKPQDNEPVEPINLRSSLIDWETTGECPKCGAKVVDGIGGRQQQCECGQRLLWR